MKPKMAGHGFHPENLLACAHQFCAAAFLIVALLFPENVRAATAAGTAVMSADYALTLTKDSDIQFGILKALTSGTYTMNTNGVVTPSGGGVVISGTPAYGQITITGSGTQTISIHTGSYVADGGVTISAASCNYNGLAIATCDSGRTGLAAPTMSGKILKLGIKAVADGTQTAGATPAPTFVVTVIYG